MGIGINPVKPRIFIVTTAGAACPTGVFAMATVIVETLQASFGGLSYEKQTGRTDGLVRFLHYNSIASRRGACHTVIHASMARQGHPGAVTRRCLKIQQMRAIGG
jgi:hypothetical protein